MHGSCFPTQIAKLLRLQGIYMRKDQAGFSLIQVLVSSALLGALTLMSMQLMRNLNQAQIFTESKFDEVNLKLSLKSILDNPKFCKVSLAGQTFRKEDIDFDGVEVQASTPFSQGDEGLNIELWYSSADGSAKTKKQFNGRDNIIGEDRSRFGLIRIESIKLVMNNGIGACSQNYCTTDSADVGQVIILYSQKINTSFSRTGKLIFPLTVNFTTDTSNTSTITGCDEQTPPSQQIALNGYYSLGNGLLVQWGVATAIRNTTTTINFNKPFTSASDVFSIVVSGTSDNDTNARDNWPSLYNHPTTTTANSFQVRSANDSEDTISWFAIGR